MFTRRQSMWMLGTVLVGAACSSLFPATAAAGPRQRGADSSITTDFSARPLGKITGVVYDVNDLPVADALVVAYNNQGHAVGRRLSARDGSFSFSVPAGKYLVRAGLHVFPSGFQEILVAVGQRIDVKVGINESVLHGRVSGTVYDRDGHKVGFAMVAIYDGAGTIVNREMTGRNGAFSFELKPGRYTIQAGFNQFPSGSIEVIARAGELTPVRLDIDESTQSGVIKGFVLDQDNQPVPGTLVAAYNQIGSGVARQLTLDDGSFSLEVPAGSYVVSAGRDQFPSGQQSANVQIGQITEMTIFVNE